MSTFYIGRLHLKYLLFKSNEKGFGGVNFYFYDKAKKTRSFHLKMN